METYNHSFRDREVYTETIFLWLGESEMGNLSWSNGCGGRGGVNILRSCKQFVLIFLFESVILLKNVTCCTDVLFPSWMAQKLLLRLQWLSHGTYIRW